MAQAVPQSEMRDRLYAAYATTHEGKAEEGSAVHAFRRDILPHLPADRTAAIVDLGCGQGQLVAQLVKSGFSRARGIDISPEQVETAHAAGIMQVGLGDYRDSLAQGSLDVVIGTDFFEHLDRFEILDALDRIRRSLRPGGRLILRVPNAVSPFGGNYRYGDLTHETSFTPRSLRQLGAAAAFSSVEIFACTPPVHGAKSALRALVWRAVSATMKVALISETGQTRGHLVTQNIVAVMRMPTR